MSLKSLRHLWHSTGCRLTLWYAALGMLQALALSVLTYVFLASSLQQRDRQHIAMELWEMVDLYHSYGVAGVQQEVASYGEPPYYFVRLVGADQATRLLTMPEPWTTDTLPPLDTMGTSAMITWTEISAPDATNRLEVASLGLDVSMTAPPSLWVTADRTRLRQVLANLLDNAIKYTPPGGRITLTACQELTGVAILVEDTGRGMTADDLAHIWDRLYRGDTSRSQRGLGLGLSLVKAIVQAHQGAVTVASTLGKGSRFTLQFPMNPPHGR